MQPFISDKLFRLFIVLSTIIFSVFILKTTLVYIYPFIIAIILTFLLHPVVSWTERWLKLNRGLATFFVMSGLGVLMFIFFFIFTERLVHGFARFTSDLPETISQVKQVMLTVGQVIHDQLMLVFPFLEDLQWREKLNQVMEKLSDGLLDITTDALLTASNALSSLSYIAIIGLFILLAVYMLTKDYHFLKSKLLFIVPRRVTIHFRPVLDYTKQAFFGLIRAQLILTSMSALLVLIGFFFFRIDHIFTWMAIVFFIDFIPYIGIGILFIPWIIYLFLTGDYLLTIKIASLYAFILVLRQVIEPRIIAKEIGIHPFLALAIVFIGYQAAGLLGILLTPFFLIFVSALHKARMFQAVYDYIHKK